MTYQVRLLEDPYADGWIAGYEQALLDVAAESDRLTSPRASRALLERLRYQHRQAGTGGVIR